MAKTEHPTCPAGFKTSIGGQAIIEGVMMKGPKKTVMSVRKPDGSIVQEGWDNPPRRWYQKVPLVRGIASFILSLTDGYKCLMRSAELATDGIEDENPSKFDKWLEEKFGDKLVKAVGYISMVLGLCIAALLFMYLPAQIVTLLRGLAPDAPRWALSLGEGVIKLGIFIGYMALVSLMPDMRRMFAYHGSEHKTIACFEAGEELTVENVRKHTRFHPRCGTSFLFLVLFISIVLSTVVTWDSLALRVALKILMLPLTMAIAYELIRLAGRYDNLFTRIVSWPGPAGPAADHQRTGRQHDRGGDRLDEGGAAREPGGRGMGAVTLEQLPALLERTGVTLSEAERAVRGLLAPVTDSPQFEAAEMLMAAYGVDKSAILLGGKLPPDAEKREALLGMVRRRLGREPLQYILGRWDFFGRPFYVGEGVLIPRPDTEVLMEQVLLGLQDIRFPRALELCGGSGCLAVTLSLERPDAEVWSVEKSEDAYRYLTRNNDALGAGVRPVLGDAFDTDSVEGDFDCILCNPPYLSAKDMAEPGTGTFLRAGDGPVRGPGRPLFLPAAHLPLGAAAEKRGPFRLRDRRRPGDGSQPADGRSRPKYHLPNP